MRQAVEAAQWAEAASLSLVGVLTIIDWLRYRSRPQAYFAWAIGLLAVVTLAGRVQADLGAQNNRVLIDIVVPLFLGSGYALVLFRHSLIPVRRGTRHAVLGIVVATSVALDVVPLSNDPTRTTPVEWAAILAFFAVWCGCVMEPVVRFWIASRGRPIVQRARLRALSLGYGGIVLVLLVALGVGIGAGPSSAQNQLYQLVVELVVLGIVPFLYVSFAPPRWVRRFWRDREEMEYRRATSDLLVEEDPALLAEAALSWALRLTGADAGLIAAPGRDLLASINLEEASQRRLLNLQPGSAARIVATSENGHADQITIIAPLQSRTLSGMLAVTAGPFTPVFGTGELSRLDEYVVSVGAAIERVQLVKALSYEIRERQRIQEELASRAVELERSNSSLQEFAYIASHDLQEPLRMVTSYLQLLKKRYQASLDETADEFINFSVDGARRMQALITDLLAYSRAGAPTAPLGLEDLNDVMRTVTTNLGQAIDESGARIRVEGSLPHVVGDATQLVQLLQNLVSNAIKFHGDRTPEVTVSGEHSGQFCTITVRDNGIGIEPRHSERIFMVFKRLHPMDEFPGTGIGLSVCRKIVERHGGHIWVDSQPGRGSAFRFTLPDREAPPRIPETDRTMAELTAASQEPSQRPEPVRGAA